MTDNDTLLYAHADDLPPAMPQPDADAPDAGYCALGIGLAVLLAALAVIAHAWVSIGM